MSTKIMYPVLIIIFSILIICAILQNKNNKRLNNGIEKFMNNYLENEKNDLKLNVQNNLAITKEFANGTWTYFYTTVDSNYNASNLITIDIQNIPSIDNSNNKNYGTVKFDPLFVFVINFISNGIIIANLYNLTINIKFLNIFSKINSTSQIPKSIISVFDGNNLINKFSSYKVYNNKVSNELYGIIKSNDYRIDSPPQLYDFNSYNKIISNDYKFPSKIITLTFKTSNDSTTNLIKQKIINNYSGKIKFSIQRVFYSPSSDGTEIITKSCDSSLISVLDNNNIPDKIIIAPFSSDKSENNLNTFFKPKETILYFYKLNGQPQSTYDFSSSVVNNSLLTSISNSTNKNTISNNNIITISSDFLKLQNGADGDNMFKKSISFNNPLSVERKNLSTFELTLIRRVRHNNLDDSPSIPFSDLYNLL